MINVLLTGAGFTANFGAPLANHIYEALFNEVTEKSLKDKFLKSDTLKDSNYEKFYTEIMNDSNSTEEEKKELKECLLKVFIQKVDKFCRQPNFQTDIYGNYQQKDLEKFLIKFFNTHDKSIFFTLNQDLFIERQYHGLFTNENLKDIQLQVELYELGIKKVPAITLKRLGVADHNILHHSGKFDDEYKLIIKEENKKDAEELYKNWKNNTSNYCFYIKLHGSQDFFDKDENPILITGIDKSNSIPNHGLIESYHKIFEEILKMKCRLIIIGYSFNDEHINSKIQAAIENECELYVINKIDMKCFFKKMNEKKFDEIEIRKCLKRYLSNGLNVQDLKNEIINQFLPEN